MREKKGCLSNLLIGILVVAVVLTLRQWRQENSYVDRLPDLNAGYDSHAFLYARDRGDCFELTGNVVLTFVMLDVPDSPWTQQDIAKFREEAVRSGRVLEQQAMEYGAQLQITERFVSCSVAEAYERDERDAWVEAALSELGYTTANVSDKVKKEYDADSSAVLFCINREDRSFAAQTSAFEYAVLFRELADYRHELLHMYGAVDFYYPELATQLAEQMWPQSIMLNAHAEEVAVDEMTAYLVGWTATVTENTRSFLDQTADVTTEQVEQSREEQSFTGEGTDTYGDAVYSGQWLNGVPYGQGRMEYESGSVYEGAFVYGEREGYGVLSYAGGDVYEGQWVDGEENGQGKLTWSNGDVYEGAWVDGERSGYGVITWHDGDVYAGDWQDGKRTGYGTYTWKDGTTYEGQWLDGQMHGEGTLRYTSGRTRTGQWDNGEFLG